MSKKIQIGICGYGNLGKGAQKAIAKTRDMELKVIFTRRNPEEIEREALKLEIEKKKIRWIYNL